MDWFLPGDHSQKSVPGGEGAHTTEGAKGGGKLKLGVFGEKLFRGRSSKGKKTGREASDVRGVWPLEIEKSGSLIDAASY